MSLYLNDTITPVTITYQLTGVSKYKFAIDLCVRLTHSNSATVTDNPIEDGSSINDHVINQPRVVTLTGLVSDYKYQLFPFNFPFATQDKPSKKVYDIFQDIYKNKRLIEIDTGLEVYENMIIESMSFPRTSDTQESLEFSLTMKEIIIVSSELTEVPDEFYKDDVKSKATTKKTTSNKTEDLQEAASKPKTTLAKGDDLRKEFEKNRRR